MAKRGLSKAELILRDAREYVVEAKDRRDGFRTQMDIAQAVYEALSLNLAALEQGLAREPRKTNPKSTTVPNVGKRSPRSKSGEESKVNTETGKETATPAAVCAVPNCGQVKGSFAHSYNNPDFHEFHAAIKTKGAGV